MHSLISYPPKPSASPFDFAHGIAFVLPMVTKERRAYIYKFERNKNNLTGELKNYIIYLYFCQNFIR